MSRRREAYNALRILETVQDLVDKRLSAATAKGLESTFAFGASEADLVDSGLEDTMVNAYHEIHAKARSRNLDLRTGAFVSAIDKIAQGYLRMGIFP